MKKWLTAIALFAGSFGLLAGNYANSVMDIGVGAKPLGMGGAYVSLAEDSSATYWNPAGLPNVKHFDVAMVQQGHGSISSGLNMNEVGSEYMFISGAMNLGDAGSIGAGFLRYGVQDIPYVPDALNGGGLNQDGSPIEKGSFKSQDIGMMLSYGKHITRGFNLGAGFKFLKGGTQGLPADASYSDYGLDLGVLLKFGEWNKTLDGLQFGFNIQDAYNSGVKWENTATSPTDAVDANFKVGASYAPPLSFLKFSKSRWTLLSIDMDTKYSPVTLLHYGTEFWYKETLGLRAGARSFLGSNDNGGTSYQQGTEASIGVSVHVLFLTVDYSYINYELTPVQYLSMGATF